MYIPAGLRAVGVPAGLRAVGVPVAVRGVPVAVRGAPVAVPVYSLPLFGTSLPLFGTSLPFLTVLRFNDILDSSEINNNSFLTVLSESAHCPAQERCYQPCLTLFTGG